MRHLCCHHYILLLEVDGGGEEGGRQGGLQSAVTEVGVRQAAGPHLVTWPRRTTHLVHLHLHTSLRQGPQQLGVPGGQGAVMVDLQWPCGWVVPPAGPH